MTKDEALKLALEAICGSGEFLFNWHDCEPNNEREIQSYQATLADNEKAFTAIREALAEQPAPPPECKTDAEKTAFAFGWWKALEENRKQPAQQEPEYKGWYCAHCQRGVDGSEVTFREQHTICGRVITDDVPPKPAQQEPVAWVRGERISWHHRDVAGLPDGTLLYTRPQAREPLSDEEICRIGAQVHGFLLCNEGQWGIEMARAIEAAHGIGEKK